MSRFDDLESNLVGWRVVRGPDWEWATQDGGEGFVGTITSLKTTNEKLDALLERLPGNIKRHLKAVNVVWDSGTAGNYRVGISGAFDLRLLDNSATVSQHHDVSCAECCRGSIEGLRWDCALCDVPLCSSCYFNDVHERRNGETHCGRLEYQRYMTFDSDPVTVWKDMSVSRVELKGIFNEARVKRGRDWESGDEDTLGSISGVGQVVPSTSNIGPGWVHVKWPGSNNTFPYRLGADGKVDLRLEKHTSGGRYQPEHLPVLKLDEMDSEGDCGMRFAMGDLARVNVDAETLKFMQDGHGGWVDDMKRVAGKTGVVLSVNPVGVILKFQELNRKYCINMDALVRLGPFSVGQPVRVTNSADTRRSPSTAKIAGRTGSVLRCLLYGYDDVEIVLDDDAEHDERRCAVHRVPASALEVLPVNEDIQNKLNKSKKKLTKLFVLAASKGQLPVLNSLWSTRFIDVNGKDKAGQTALQLASRRGHADTVEWLLEKEASAGLGDDKKERNAVHHAAKGGQPAILVTLVRGNRELLEVTDKKGWTPLHLAMRAGCVKSIRVLVDSGCDVYATDKSGDTALFNAIIMETKLKVYRDHAIVDTLLESTDCLDHTNHHGLNTVMIAALYGNKRVLKNLLKSGRLGTSLFRQSRANRFTALHALCHEGDYLGLKVFMAYAPEDAVRELIERRSNHGFTPLLLAAYKCRYGAVEFLVSGAENRSEIRANVTAVDDDGDTAAHLVAAVMDKHSEKPSERESPEIHKIYRDLSIRHPEIMASYPALSLLCYLVRHGCPWRRTFQRKALAVINNDMFRSILMEYCPYGDSSGDTASRIVVCPLCLTPNAEAGVVEGCNDTLPVCSMCALKFPLCLTCGRPNMAYERNQTKPIDEAKSVSTRWKEALNQEIAVAGERHDWAGIGQRRNAAQDQATTDDASPLADQGQFVQCAIDVPFANETWTRETSVLLAEAFTALGRHYRELSARLTSNSYACKPMPSLRSKPSDVKFNENSLSFSKF